MGRFKLAIIIPAKNESATIEKVVDSIKKYGDILVINDASSDNTEEILKKRKIKYLKNNRALGYEKTILKGINFLLKKNYTHIATFDADGEHDSNFFRNIKKYNKYDLIIGNRKSFNRVSEYIFSWITNFFFEIKDPFSGLKIYKVDFLKKIKIQNKNLLNIFILFQFKFKGGNFFFKQLNVYKRKDNSRLGNTILVNFKIIYYLLKLFIFLFFLKKKNQ